MNQIAHISYEDRAKARAKEIRLRLMGPQKRVNVFRRGEIELVESNPDATAGKTLSAEADAHVRVYHQWMDCVSKRTNMMEHAQVLCEEVGTTLSEIRLVRNNRPLVAALDSVALKMHLMFPTKPMSEIGRVLNRDASTIFRSIERESIRLGIIKPDLSNSKFPKLEAYLREGKTLMEIAAIYNVGISTISRRVNELSLAGLRKPTTKSVTMTLIETVRQEYAAGDSLQDISARHGFSVRSITNWKKTFGWPSRLPRRKG